MTTREKIIVGIMCLTIVYGAYELIFRGRSRPAPPPTVSGSTTRDLKSFVAEITGKLANEKVSKDYQHMIRQAGADWTKDPFIQSSAPLKKRLSAAGSAPKKPAKKAMPRYTYSGYMQLGNTKLAIINGVEYTVGEKLLNKAYYVKTISTNKVVIAKLNGAETIQIFITETDGSPGL